MIFGRSEKQAKESTDEVVEYGPLYAVGWSLTTVSMIWSLYSIQDLMNPAPHLGREWTDIYTPGLVVGLGAEAFWGVVQYLNHRKIQLKWPWLVPYLGWFSVASVMGLLVWHGADRGNVALAVAGPIVPLVAKLAWVGWDALNSSPSALTEDQEAQLNNMERMSKFEGAKAKSDRVKERREHEAKLARIEMQGELTIAQSDVDFKVFLDRSEKEAELDRVTPIRAQIIRGQVERPQIQAPVHRASIPAARARTNEVTMSVGDLTEAQRKNKAIAVEWYLTEGVSQNEFARSKEISGGHLSRILARFPRDLALDDEDQLGA